MPFRLRPVPVCSVAAMSSAGPLAGRSAAIAPGVIPTAWIGSHGDAAFADYLSLASYSVRFGGRHLGASPQEMPSCRSLRGSVVELTLRKDPFHAPINADNSFVSDLLGIGVVRGRRLSLTVLAVGNPDGVAGVGGARRRPF